MIMQHIDKTRSADRRAKLIAVLIVALPLISLAAGAAAALVQYGAI